MVPVSATDDLPRPDHAAEVRAALLAAGFTADGLLDLLGAPAYAALARSETVPAERATRWPPGGTPPALATLTRLFLLQHAVPRAHAAAVLPLEACLADGWVRRDGEAVRSVVDVRPYSGPAGQDWWIVSDLGCAVGGAAGARRAAASGTGGPGPSGADLVLGVGGASTTLAGLTVPLDGGRVLDVGTGSGIQALHAGARADAVTATDVNPRALACARLTLALSGAPAADLRAGSLFEPVAGERYDLIVSNPPFVISPAARLTYRDGGMAGDELCRTLVRRAADHLADGGYCQLLANWQHVEGEDWRERVAGWVPPGCDAWVVQREVQDVTQYTELWLRDAGDHADPAAYAARYDDWLDAFAAGRTRAVGFGWITLRRTDAAESAVTVEDWPHAVEQPLGEAVVEHFARQDFLRRTDDAALLATTFRLADDVVQEQVGRPGEEDPEHVVLRRERGMRRATRADTVAAGFAGACDGTLPAGVILDAIAQVLEEDPAELRERTPGVIRLLVEQGFLAPE